MAKFEISKSNLDKLSKYISEISVEAEETINNYLEQQGSAKVDEEIRKLIHIGNKKHSKKQPKGHAKTSDSIKIKMINLGFIVKNDKKYGYLYFPNEGQGTSKKNKPQLIFETGVKNSQDYIVNGLEENLIKKLGGN